MAEPPLLWHAWPEVPWRDTLCGLTTLPTGEAAGSGLTVGGCPACHRTYDLLVKIDALAQRLPEEAVRTVVRAVARSSVPETEQSARDVLAVLRVCAALARGVR